MCFAMQVKCKMRHLDYSLKKRGSSYDKKSFFLTKSDVYKQSSICSWHFERRVQIIAVTFSRLQTYNIITIFFYDISR